MFCGHIFSAQYQECMAIYVFPFEEPYLKLKICDFLLFTVDSNSKNPTTNQMLIVTHTTVQQVKKWGNNRIAMTIETNILELRCFLNLVLWL